MCGEISLTNARREPYLMSIKPQPKDQTRMNPSEYIRQVKSQLQAGKPEKALTVLQQSMTDFPNMPVLLSYYGYLIVLVEKKYRMGIEICQKAFDQHKKEGSLDKEMLYPMFYCNLGRAYAAAGKRKEALETLKKGLVYEYGSTSSEIKKELQSMGTRSRPLPFPFLDRAHPLNRYIGIMFYRKNGTSNAQKKNAQR
jgi:tetratricopeptide (TPR) repeat protein